MTVYMFPEDCEPPRPPHVMPHPTQIFTAVTTVCSMNLTDAGDSRYVQKQLKLKFFKFDTSTEPY